jgi:hypothetical protein
MVNLSQIRCLIGLMIESVCRKSRSEYDRKLSVQDFVLYTSRGDRVYATKIFNVHVVKFNRYLFPVNAAPSLPSSISPRQ